MSAQDYGLLIWIFSQTFSKKEDILAPEFSFLLELEHFPVHHAVDVARADELVVACLLANFPNCERHVGATRYEYHVASFAVSPSLVLLRGILA